VKEPPIHKDNQPLEGAYHVARLIAGYIQGTLNPKEHDELDEWVAASDENMKLFEELTDEKNIEETMEWYRKIDAEAALKKVKEQIGLRPKNNFNGRRLLLYAAMVIFIAGAGVVVYYKNRDSGAAAIVKNDVAPGSDKAVLTLADGRKIFLDSAGSGVLNEEGNVKVVQKGGVVAYSSQQPAANSQPLVYNTISVPRGGQFKIILSDGSAVWLNSESELRYPVAFAGEREVELKGEAYFEVVPHPQPASSGFQPPSPDGEGKRKTVFDSKGGEGGNDSRTDNKLSFSVNINGARVEVLGTHFNVNSYDNEEGRKVTLVEGKVRVSSEVSAIRYQQSGSSGQQSAVSNQQELKPGEEAVISGDGKIRVNKVDADEAVAWTKGRFYFRDATIKKIMQQLERWYEIEVLYEDKISYNFNEPDVPRDMQLNKVLKVLEMTKNVRFEVEGKGVRVRKYDAPIP
jgi:ferric-dicitrate binding protein FerR (iron transport regulator)